MNGGEKGMLGPAYLTAHRRFLRSDRRSLGSLLHTSRSGSEPKVSGERSEGGVE